MRKKPATKRPAPKSNLSLAVAISLGACRRVINRARRHHNLNTMWTHTCLSDRLWVHARLGVPYPTPWKEVRQLLIANLDQKRGPFTITQYIKHNTERYS